MKQFAPSEYAIRDNGDWDFYAGKIPVWEATKASGMEYTQFTCGIFMNTLGTGTPNGETEALGGLRPWTFVINMKAGTADLPGDGNSKVTFTRTQDIGKFVAAALDLEKWEDEMGMVGSTMSYNEVVTAIEKVTRRKMLRKETPEEELKKMIREDEGAKFYNQVRLSIAQVGAPVEPTLNKLAPEIKPWTVEQYLERYWSGVELGEAAWAKGNIIIQANNERRGKAQYGDRLLCHGHSKTVESVQSAYRSPGKDLHSANRRIKLQSRRSRRKRRCASTL